MKLKFLFFLILAILFISGCEDTSQEKPYVSGFSPEPSQIRISNWKMLVGSWYGSQKTKDGGTYSWIIRRNIQGIYRLEGKITMPSGEVQKKVEVGEWGVGSNIYFSVYKGWIRRNEFIPSDPSDPYNRDIYKIIKLSENEFRYQHLDNGETFIVEKVPDDYQMPEFAPSTDFNTDETVRNEPRTM